MTLQTPTSHTFHVTVLYSSTRQERENRTGADRLATNRMLNQQQQNEGEEEATYELQPALQQLCHTLNAFIFVVDASGSKESGEYHLCMIPLHCGCFLMLICCNACVLKKLVNPVLLLFFFKGYKALPLI